MNPPSLPAPSDAPTDAHAHARVRVPSDWILSAVVGLLWTVALAVLGFAFVIRVDHALERNPDLSVFYRFFVGHEPIALALLAAFAALCLGDSMRGGDGDLRARGAAPDRPLARGTVRAIAAAVVLVAALGTHLVMRDLPLSGDEYSVVYQARVLARGALAAPLPEAWRPLLDALVPPFVGYAPAAGGLLSLYLPVNATLRAPFELLGMGPFANAVLAGCTVLGLAAAARRIWPHDDRTARIAVLSLALSPQFLLMAMTAYAMPPHLLANVVWLALYLAGTRRAVLLLPVVGALALGLHNPFPHALFVAPFLLRMLRDRRHRALAYLAAVYAVGCVAWVAWYLTMHPVGAAAGGLASVFALPDLGSVEVQLIGGLLLLTWNVPFIALGVWTVGRTWAVQPAAIRDLAWGVVLTLGFYLFFPSDPHHGWGYRYAHGIVASLALLSAQGLRQLAAVGPGARRLVARWTTIGLAGAALLLVPLRARQASEFVRPHAEVHAWLRARDAAVVVVPDTALWYGLDLVRNTPWLERPVVLRASELPEDGLPGLRRRFGARLHVASVDEIARLGWRRLARPVPPWRLAGEPLRREPVTGGAVTAAVPPPTAAAPPAALRTAAR